MNRLSFLSAKSIAAAALALGAVGAASVAQAADGLHVRIAIGQPAVVHPVQHPVQHPVYGGRFDHRDARGHRGTSSAPSVMPTVTACPTCTTAIRASTTTAPPAATPSGATMTGTAW